MYNKYINYIGGAGQDINDNKAINNFLIKFIEYLGHEYQDIEITDNILECIITGNILELYQLNRNLVCSLYTFCTIVVKDNINFDDSFTLISFNHNNKTRFLLHHKTDDFNIVSPIYFMIMYPGLGLNASYTFILFGKVNNIVNDEIIHM